MTTPPSQCPPWCSTLPERAFITDSAQRWGQDRERPQGVGVGPGRVQQVYPTAQGLGDRPVGPAAGHCPVLPPAHSPEDRGADPHRVWLEAAAPRPAAYSVWCLSENRADLAAVAGRARVRGSGDSGRAEAAAPARSCRRARAAVRPRDGGPLNRMRAAPLGWWGSLPRGGSGPARQPRGSASSASARSGPGRCGWHSDLSSLLDN